MSTYLWYFLIYAFLGWCIEVIYAAVNRGIFVNRGFLNGTLCPIYGFGAVVVIVILLPYKDNVISLFIGSVILATLLELLTGWILEKAFSQKWWDYSDLPYNISGYVSLKFSLIWGITCVLLIDVVHPIIDSFVTLIDMKIGNYILVVFFMVLIIDFVASVLSVLNLNKQLRKINQFATHLRNISDDIGGRIFEESIALLEKKEKLKNKGFKRIFEAYPNLKSIHFDQELKELRNKIFVRKK